MGCDDQLEILKRGPSAWNLWRRTSREAIDLSGATLHDTRAPWREEELVRLDLEGINFRNANLEGAVLRGANLRGADLAGANLRYAILRRANLAGAMMRGAKLCGANLTLASLRDANLTNALMWETVIARTDLRNAIGLEEVKHGGPSMIDHRTLRKSGKLPREFLQGLGLPNSDIKQLMPDMPVDSFEECFISYSSADSKFVDRFHEELQSSGVRCWYAPEDMGLGAKIRPTLHDAISSSDRLVIVLSENSINSDWVEDEVERALQMERQTGDVVILPVRIDGNRSQGGIKMGERLDAEA